MRKEWNAIKAAMVASNEQWWKEKMVFPAIMRVHPFGTRDACEFFEVTVDQFQEWNWKQHKEEVKE